MTYFNPHEREARDAMASRKQSVCPDFNPHEREARDYQVSTSLLTWQILIHTSVKLVTQRGNPERKNDDILIHTSVKLVTRQHNGKKTCYIILIHTSVKLVTWLYSSPQGAHHNFNPHEREARDDAGRGKGVPPRYFNPHEREARDLKAHRRNVILEILIHTSVKLVTGAHQMGM